MPGTHTIREYLAFLIDYPFSEGVREFDGCIQGFTGAIQELEGSIQGFEGSILKFIFFTQFIYMAGIVNLCKEYRLYEGKCNFAKHSWKDPAVLRFYCHSDRDFTLNYYGQ